MLATLAQTISDGDGGTSAGIFGGAFLIIGLAFVVVYIASAWKVWAKMGDPGWMGLVPFLNLYRIYQRSRPDQAVAWTVGSVLCFIAAFVGIADLAKLFGKDVGYALGMIFLPFIFFPMLAFGSAQYVGPPAPQLS